MSVNVVVIDGIVKSLTLKYDAEARPELRFTLVQTEKDWQTYLPFCAVSTTAERLAGELTEGQSIVVTSGKLCYRKRDTKLGAQSRLEILVWTVQPLSPALAGVPNGAPTPESSDTRATSAASTPRRTRSATWPPAHAN